MKHPYKLHVAQKKTNKVKFRITKKHANKNNGKVPECKVLNISDIQMKKNLLNNLTEQILLIRKSLLKETVLQVCCKPVKLKCQIFASYT